MPTLRISLLAGAMGMALAACQTSSPTPQFPLAVLADEALADETNIIVLVGSEQAANALLVNATRRGYQLNDRQRLSGLDLVLMDFERPKGVSGPVAIGDMQGMEPSATAGVDHLFLLQAQDGEPVNSNARLYADDLMGWPVDGCAANISVGIIDGDVDTDAPGLSDALIVERDFSEGAPAAGDHATAIADLLVGPGKLRSTRLHAASVVSTNTPQTGAGVRELILALDWMLESNVKLVNISLAGPYNALLDKAVGQAVDKGMIIVAAVGNDGPDAEPRYPAAFDDVIAVTAIDSALEIYSRAVRGEHIDFAAP
ncbi:MAG: S8 family serine peptidase, partial [Pseudomonadota bacterium]